MKALEILHRLICAMAGAGIGFIIAGLLAGGGKTDDDR